MGLTVYHSDRIEDLAAHLQRRLLDDDYRKKHPFQFTRVVVPNNNIAKWLQTRRFAHEPRLTAGIDFCFIDYFLRDTLREALRKSNKLPHGADADEAPDSLANRSLTYAVMRVLLDPTQADPALAPFYSYIWPPAEGEGPRQALGEAAGAATARLAWQLAGKLARLLDLYEARRPEMIADWLNLENQKTLPQKYHATPGSVAAAEIALAHKILGPEGPLPGQSLRQLLQTVNDERIAPSVDAGQTLYFFGQSTLTKTQAQVLHWLANNGVKIIFYYNNVCLEYWADIERDPMPWAKFRDQIDPLDPKIENELLRDWGFAGRETIDILCQMEEGSARGERAWFEWKLCPAAEGGSDRESGAGEAGEPTSVLAAVQAAIRRRTSALAKLPQDDTLQVFGAPGIRREVETVYNAIFAATTGANGGAPCPVRDIAVLVPNMKTYRPYIEAVFGERGEIPYSIVDTTAADFSHCLSGLNALFALHREGLNRDTLFAVLENPLVQAALRFTAADVHDWRKLTERIGAFTHFDPADAASRGADPAGAANVTWQTALQRLRLSTVAVDLPAGALPDSAPARDALCEGGGLRFSAIVERLWREVARAFGDGGKDAPTQASWRETFRRLIDVFLNPDAPRLDPQKRALESNVRGHVLSTLTALEAAKLPHHGADFALEAVNAFAGGAPCDHGGYLTGGVTVAGLLPMRPVPFKLTFVLGLSEGEFPGTRAESTLDLRMAGLGTKVRDAALPEINRFLFLETLMATRKRLVLSYVNLDPAKNATLFPCSVIRQLERFLNKSVLSGGKFEEIEIKLLEADQAANAPDEGNGLLATFYPPARRLARERASSPTAAASQKGASGPGRAGGARDEDFDLTTLAEFLKSPLQGLMHSHFAIDREYYRAQGLSAETPLTIDKLEFWDMQMELLQQLAETPGLGDQAAVDAKAEKIFAELFHDRQRQGAAPGGFIGVFDRDARRAETRVPREFLSLFLQARGAAPAPGNANGQGAPTLAYDKLIAAPLDIGKTAIHYPPKQLLPAWLAWLQDLATGGARDCFTAIVLDFRAPAAATFSWESNKEEAEGYLTALREDAAAYLAQPAGTDGHYLTWEYQEIAKAWHEVATDPDHRWQNVAEAVLAGQGDEGHAPDTGYKDLVIEETLSAHVIAREELIGNEHERLAKWLERLAQELYQPFLEGKSDVVF